LVNAVSLNWLTATSELTGASAVSVTGVRVSTEQRFDSVLIRGFNCLPELSNTHTQLGLVVYDPLCQSVKTATKTLTVIATTTTTTARKLLLLLLLTLV